MRYCTVRELYAAFGGRFCVLAGVRSPSTLVAQRQCMVERKTHASRVTKELALTLSLAVCSVRIVVLQRQHVYFGLFPFGHTAAGSRGDPLTTSAILQLSGRRGSCVGQPFKPLSLPPGTHRFRSKAILHVSNASLTHPSISWARLSPPAATSLHLHK
jgi:hypothetical protein